MRGQVKLEFVLAVVAFAVVSFAIATQINNTFNIVASDSRIDTLRTRAAGLTELLVTDKSWMSDGRQYSINRTRLSEIDASRDTYNQCTAFSSLNLGGYIITVSNSTNTLLRCGAASAGGGAVSTSRVVWIENDYGLITVEMW